METIRTIEHVTGPTITVSLPPEFKGQRVEVQVRVLPAASSWGEGLRRCAGALADEWTEEDDRVLAEIHKDRKRTSGRILPE